jgi:hypothetical protein
MCEDGIDTERIAQRLDRSEGSVQRRARALGLPLTLPRQSWLPAIDRDSAMDETS